MHIGWPPKQHQPFWHALLQSLQAARLQLLSPRYESYQHIACQAAKAWHTYIASAQQAHSNPMIV